MNLRSVLEPPTKIIRIALAIGLPLFVSNTLFAVPPTIIGSDLETIFGSDDTISGSAGGSFLVFEIDYSFDVNRTTIDSNDLICEGQSGAASGKMIPIELEFAYNNFSKSAQTGRYKMGPLDSTANGTYSLKIVENQVFNGSGEAVAAGEILLFTQDVNDPMPAVLDVRFDPPLTSEGFLEGPLGFERPKMIIDFNKDVSINFFTGFGIEIVGTGSAEGLTITQVVDFPILELEDKITAEFILGPLDVANNGAYSVRVLEDTIRSIGDTPAYVPAGEIASFTQNITNPPPRLLTELNGFPIEDFLPIADIGGYSLTLTFNYVVDTEQIDVNDIRVVGISENNLGKELKVLDVSVGGQNFPSNDAYARAIYFLTGEDIPDDPFNLGEFKEAFNGEWEVQIVEGEIVDREDPPNALPPQVVGTLLQDVVDPFRAVLQGRIYEETGTPSLVDDGFAVDPGLDIGFRLETLENGGIGYHELNTQRTASKLSLTGLALPFNVSEAALGEDPAERVFEISGESGSLQSGSVFTVTGSTGNDGSYTVKNTNIVYEGSSAKTFVFVDEAIPSDVSDGRIITAETYTGKVTIDGDTVIDLSIEALKAETFGDLLDELNAQLGAAGTAVLPSRDTLRIESSSFGSSSSVLIDDTINGVNLFSVLQGYGGGQLFLGAPVPGSDEWVESFYTNDIFIDSEEDYGKFSIRLRAPGRYRIQSGMGAVYNPETDTFDWILPYPEWVVQTLGDPNRDLEPKDHTMYLDAARDMSGTIFTRNFSYVEENESPEAIEDDAEFDLAFQVPRNSSDYLLDVLKNDTYLDNPPQPGDLKIIGVSPGLGISTETTSNGSRQFSTITTDGDFIYYTPWANFTGWELFYYTIEDRDGKRDFAPVYILVTFGQITSELFILDDRFQVTPNSADNILNVLGNDFTTPAGNNSLLSITGLGTSPGSTATTAVGSAGGSITTTDNRTVIYTPVADFEGVERFFYNVTDGGDGTGSAQVSVSVIADETELNPVIGNYSSELARMMSRTEQGRRLLDLFQRYAPEFYAILVGNPEIGGEVASLAERLGLGIQVSATGSRIRPLVEVGAGGEVLKTFDAFQDGVVALLSGQGSEVTLTQEIVDQAVALRDLIYEEASDEMKADIDAEIGNLESRVGENFEQFFESFGVDSGDVSLIVYSPFRSQDSFLVRVQNLEGFNYVLWKSTTLKSDEWAVVEDATIQYFPTNIVITDPNPGETQTFYRLQRVPDSGN